jgi:DNA invertase Pin-like site-specific DNA recombinase
MLLGFARCSTEGQDHALQIDALRKAGVERVYEETASGLKSDRPVLQRMVEEARAGDVIVVYSLSRIGRSIRHLLDLVLDLDARQIGLKSLTETIDTTTAQGRFVFTLFSALNQFEVELLRERTRAGLEAARARGRTGGRPRSLVGQKVEVARTLLSTGEMTVGEIAQQMGVSIGTIYRAFPGGRGAICSGSS